MLLVAALVLTAAGAIGFEQSPAASPPGIRAAIDQLGSTDYPTRVAGARAIRRAAAAQAVPALIEAVTEHKDGYVRFRALVLLTGFNDPRTKDVAIALLESPNDRLRTVAYDYFGSDAEPDAVPALLSALAGEKAVFVRPALVRALAAHGAEDARVREALVREVAGGTDLARGAAIHALGDCRAQFAAAALADAARREGPLQGDAVLALGKAGDKSALAVLSALQRSAPREIQPQIAAAICLIGVNCSTHQGYLEKVLRFGERNPDYQPLLRGAAAGLGAIAQMGNDEALSVLFEAGVPARDPARAPIALAVAAAALRNPMLLLAAFQARAERGQAVELLRDGFDMLEEDYAKERFFVAIRRAYWKAPEGSEARKVAELLIQKLDF
jgi:HEAT repeat protein